MNNKTIVKKGYKMTKLGFIPDDWRVMIFNEVFDFINTPSFSRKDLTDEETTTQVKYIHYGDIHAKFESVLLDVSREQIPFLKDELVDLSKLNLLIDGDLVIADASEDYKGVGECVELINVGQSKIVGGLHTIVARAKNGNTCNGYNAYIFRNNNVRKNLKSIATGTSVYGISKGNLSKLKIPLPSLLEQKKIARIFSIWEKSIGLIENLIELKGEKKRGLVQRLLTAKLRVKGFNDKWKERKFEEVFSFVSTYAFSREDLSYDDKYLVYNIHYGDIHSSFEGNFIDFEKNAIPKIIQPVNVKSPEHYLQDGDLIMADVSEDNEGVGECMEVTNINGKKAIGGLHTFVIRDGKGYTIPTFRTYLFNETVVRNKLRRIATGSSVYGISKKSLSQIHLPLPSIDEQLEISKILINVDKEIELLQNKLEVLKEQKKGLMQQLLTGKIRV